LSPALAALPIALANTCFFRALAFMGGVPAQLVPDNPKVGVDRVNWYEPGKDEHNSSGGAIEHARTGGRMPDRRRLWESAKEAGVAARELSYSAP
jgi:hypothetical protein